MLKLVAAALSLYAAGVTAAELKDLNCWKNKVGDTSQTKLECLNYNAEGTIPILELVQPASSLMSNLEALRLYRNKLSGIIPSEVGQLTSLKVLAADTNAFSGYMPTEIGLLYKMTGMNLKKNQLSGTIPPEYGGLGYVKGPPEQNKISWTAFSISQNYFSGCIPDELRICENDGANSNCYLTPMYDDPPDGTNIHAITSCQTNAPTTAAPTETPTENPTAAPTVNPTASPTTAAPTTTPLCKWTNGYGLIGYGEKKGNPDYADGVKRREKLYGKRKVCRAIQTPTYCTEATTKTICAITESGQASSQCSWIQITIRKGRKVKREFRCREVKNTCSDNNSYSKCLYSGNGCQWTSQKTGLDRLFSGTCDTPSSCLDSKSKFECNINGLGCVWKGRKCKDLPITCEGAKRKAICDRVGIDNAV